MSTMSDNKDMLLSGLRNLGLEAAEAEIYLILLREPSTALRLSRVSGVARTKVYRVIDSLEKRSLVARHTDDRGTFFAATDPNGLAAGVALKEQELLTQKETLQTLLPVLTAFKGNDENLFAVRTYEGDEGLRQ